MLQESDSEDRDDEQMTELMQKSLEEAVKKHIESTEQKPGDFIIVQVTESNGNSRDGNALNQTLKGNKNREGSMSRATNSR